MVDLVVGAAARETAAQVLRGDLALTELFETMVAEPAVNRSTGSGASLAKGHDREFFLEAALLFRIA